MTDTDILQRFKTATARIGAARLAQPGAQPAQPSRARLIFGLDATASRQPTWDLACTHVASMFAAAGQVGGLDVQLVYFGGMTPPRAGPWVSDARRLTSIMTSVYCRSGITQIGKLLDHVGREHARTPVAAFVYIGDTVEENGETLIAAASRLGVRCFVFHEDPAANFTAAPVLRAIAARSGGVYLPFDATAVGGFRELLAGIAAFAAGGRAALETRNDAGSRLLLQKL